MSTKGVQSLLGVSQVPQVQAGVSASREQKRRITGMPAHTVDAAIMRILYILADGLTSGIYHLDAPALYHACIDCIHVCMWWRQD